MNNGDKEKLAQCEKTMKEVKSDIKELDTKIDMIMSNHLPHIQEELVSLKVRVWLVMGIGGFVVGTLATFIIDKL